MAAILLIVAFIGLMIYITKGGIYATKTIGAMGFRTGVSLVFNAWAFFTINKKGKEANNGLPSVIWIKNKPL